MHLNIALLLLIVTNCSLIILTYEIPKIKFELLPNGGFRVLIPDTPGVNNVFSVIKINRNCSVLFDSVNEAINNNWVTEQLTTKLEPNDELTITLLVQKNDELFKKSEYLKITNNGYEFIEKPKDDYLSEAECGSEDFPHNYDELNVCQDTETVVLNVDTQCRGDLIFEENFNDTQTLNQLRWKHDIQIQLNGDISEEFVIFDDLSNNTYLSDGFLNIRPTISPYDIRFDSINLKDKCTASRTTDQQCKIVVERPFKVLPPVYSAQINTFTTFCFMYGRIEIRAKLPKGDWLLPYIMLKPRNDVNDMDRAHSPQIHIAFARGNVHLKDNKNDEIGGSRLYAGTVFWENDVSHTVNMQDISRSEHFGDDFHVYQLKWKKDSISVAVDGVDYGTIDQNMKYFQQQLSIVVGVSVGGHLYFPDEAKSGPNYNVLKPWNNTSPTAVLKFWGKRDDWLNTWNGDEALLIDYIRVYAV